VENQSHIEHSLCPQPAHQPVISWGRSGDHPEARQPGELNCIVANRSASPIYQNLDWVGGVTERSATLERARV